VTTTAWQATVPAQARGALAGYLDLLDAALPGACAGVYLTGSAALGDWLPDRSDLDILTIVAGDLQDADLDALAALHAAQAGRPYLDAVYVPAGALGQPSQPGHAGYPHVIDGQFHRDGYEPDPVLWATLHRNGITISGPDATDLGAAPDPGWLKDWNLGNLDSYWRSWAHWGHAKLAEHEPESAMPASTAAWALLGPGRLHCTIATGEVISKTAAAGYTARVVPGCDELLQRAKRWRLGDDAVTFTAAEGLAACDLIDAIIQGAAQL
jgi:Nucleotidyltransferase domain